MLEENRTGRMCKTVSMIAMLISLYSFLGATPKREVLILKNGMKVVLVKDSHVRATSVVTYHMTGMRDDPNDMKGISYIIQKLMFMGTRNSERYDNLMFFRKSGGRAHSVVGYDKSFFSVIVPDHELINALWYESERIRSMKVDVQSISNMQRSIYRRLSGIVGTNLRYRAKAWVLNKVFEGTLYALPVYGKLEEFRSFSPVRIRESFSRYKDPSRIIMIISGNFNSKSLKEFIYRTFSKLKAFAGAAQGMKNYKFYKPRDVSVFQNWVIPDIDKNVTLYGIRAPSRMSQGYYGFEVIRCYLGDPRVSVYLKLLNQTYNVDVNVKISYTNHFEANAFVIELSSKVRADLEKAKFILGKYFKSLTSRKLTNYQLKRIKGLIKLDFLKRMTDPGKRSEFIAEGVHCFQNPAMDKVFLTKIKSVNANAILRLCKKYLKKKNQVVLNVYKK